MVISSTEKKQCKVKWAKFGVFICLLRILLGFPGGASGNEPSCQCRRLETNWIPGLGRSLGGGDGNPLQYSCLENPMHSGTWWAMVHRVTKSQIRLKWLSTHACSIQYILKVDSFFSFMEILFLMASLAFLCWNDWFICGMGRKQAEIYRPSRGLQSWRRSQE